MLLESYPEIDLMDRKEKRSYLDLFLFRVLTKGRTVEALF